MKKLILLVFLALSAQVMTMQAQEIGLTAQAIQETIVGKWVLLNANPANSAPFQEFTVKGPGYGELGKQKDGDLVKVISKIITNNSSISFSDADGEKNTFRIVSLSKTSLRITDGKTTLSFGRK